jgi:hypothetical protein
MMGRMDGWGDKWMKWCFTTSFTICNWCGLSSNVISITNAIMKTIHDELSICYMTSTYLFSRNIINNMKLHIFGNTKKKFKNDHVFNWQKLIQNLFFPWSSLQAIKIYHFIACCKKVQVKNHLSKTIISKKLTTRTNFISKKQW